MKSVYLCLFTAMRVDKIWWLDLISGMLLLAKGRPEKDNGRPQHTPGKHELAFVRPELNFGKLKLAQVSLWEALFSHRGL